jgi:rhamnose transport system ATP-binding protein
MLHLHGIEKRFGPTQALRGVDLDLVPGQALALVGENGAGKSTLVKTLTGVHAPDAGEIRLDGRAVRFARTHDAQAAGIVAVHQETVVFDALSAAENIFIGRPPTRGPAGLRVVDWRRMEREAQGWLDAAGAQFSARTPARDLGIAQRHQLEIARALSSTSRRRRCPGTRSRASSASSSGSRRRAWRCCSSATSSTSCSPCATATWCCATAPRWAAARCARPTRASWCG